MTSDDLTLALWNHFMRDPRVVAQVGVTAGVPWVFRNNLPPTCQVSGSGTSAIIVWSSGGWTMPSMIKTAKYPRLFLDIVSDASRDENRMKTLEDARPRADRLWSLTDAVLHRPHGEVKFYDQTVFGSHRLTEPEETPLKESDGSILLRTEYGVIIP